MSETWTSIAAWADATFGPSSSNLRVAVRMTEEMAELLTKLAVDDAHPGAAEELADLFITAARLVHQLGINLPEEIDRKMKINRARKWKLDGSGCGQHE